MAMLQTQDTDRVYVSADNAKKAIRLRLGPGKGGPPRLVELTPSQARKIALFLLQSAERMEESGR